MKKIYLFLLTFVSQVALAQNEFITRWDLSITGSGDAELNFDLATSGPVSYTWTEGAPGTDTGSGTFDSGTATITGLPTGATIELRISPVNFERIMINDGPDKDRLIDVEQWGAAAWKSMEHAFNGCSNLQISATDVPDLSAVTSMQFMLRGCTVLNSPVNIGSWNTQNVENMSQMFEGAIVFDQPIGSWNTQNVKYMFGMFQGAAAFNQPIGGWDTEKVEDMDSMFEDAIAFNQPIGSWNTLSLTDLAEMFRGAASFNQDIGNWKTEKVIAMYGMFRNAVTFNRDISSWNTGNVRSTANMFEGAVAFNQPIGSWDMQNVINLHRMFVDATVFNQPIGSWETQNVDNMSQMFLGAGAFNQPIGDWDTQKVFDMNRMFQDAGAFDQPIGSWTLKASVNLTNMFLNSGLSCYHYSETLKGWSANPATPDGLILNANGRTYSLSAVNARNNLIAKGWTIGDDTASDTECSSPLPVTLVSFSGQKNNENQNVLKWATADEKDFDRFEIQRSEDALYFEKIGEVYGKAATMGAETRSTPILAEYGFTDRSHDFSNYYRLKMIDRDGSFEYSRIISIENAAAQAVVGSFYPNPSSGKVWVDVIAIESGRWVLTVVDASGKNIARRTYDLQKGKNTITLEHFVDGINLVRFEYGRLSEIRKLIRK